MDDDRIEYSKREAVAREVLRVIGTGYEFPFDASLCDRAESIFACDVRARKAVDVADAIIAIMQSKRRAWPREKAA